MKSILSIYLLGLAFFIVVSCNSNSKTQAESKQQVKPYPYDVVVYTYDSCEYVQFGSRDCRWGGHKGNCKYCSNNSKEAVDSLKKVIEEQKKEISDFKSRLLPEVGVAILSFEDGSDSPMVSAETVWNTNDSSFLRVGKAEFRFVKANHKNRIGSSYVLYRTFP